MLARLIARIHPLVFYVLLAAAFVGLAMLTDGLKPELRGTVMNLSMLGVMLIWIFAVWLVCLQAFPGSALFGFNLLPRIVFLTAILLSVGGAFALAGVALYMMFTWRVAEGLERAIEKSEDVSLLKASEIFVPLAFPPVGVWVLRRAIKRVALSAVRRNRPIEVDS